MDKLQPTPSFGLPIDDANGQVPNAPANLASPTDHASNQFATGSSAPVNAVPIGPDAAEDVDLIEKAWVEKAKEIVGRTRNDPHNQNSEINRFKADYLKKRYSKDIKLNEK